jgi:uncharacterized protein (TIGR03437 family)
VVEEVSTRVSIRHAETVRRELTVMDRKGWETRTNVCATWLMENGGMLCVLILLIFFSASQMFGSVQTLPALPIGTTGAAIQVDASGNIYVAGGFTPQSPRSTADTSDAFVAKLSADGSQVIWFTTLGGSSTDSAMALAIGSDGSVYVTGTTSSPDFPTTPGSLQPGLGVTGSQAFAAKLSPTGAVVYSTFIGGSDSATGNAVTVDSSGDAFITGSLGFSGAFPTTPGAVTGATSTHFNTAYIVELNPAGSAALVSIQGFGGNAIAVDAQGNIYAAGAFAGPLAPATPGAFQTSSAGSLCASSLFGGSSPCAYQHISKIDPTGTRLFFATYVAGQWGAVPEGIAVDAAGNVIVAGGTFGADYPVTSGAYQSLYFPSPFSPILGPFTVEPPASAGYVTKLNASGTGVLWSSYFSGSHADRINAMEMDASGNIVIGGSVVSTDLPGLWATPVASRPPTGGSGFVARFTPDGGAISATQLTSGAVTGLAVRSDGTAVIVAGVPEIVSFPANGRVYAIADPADNARVVTVAPGQLLTLYGTNLAPATPASPLTGFPTSFNGVTVTFNGIPAPILYTSGIQINLQVPYEIASQTQVTMRVSSQLAATPVSESYILGVVSLQPSVFLSGSNFALPMFGELACNGTVYAGPQALAVNQDGSVNSCTNPARPGSIVSFFVNGLGATSPGLATGAINTTPPVAITPAVLSATGFALQISTVAAPGAISSVAETSVQLYSKGFSFPLLQVPLVVNGVQTREQSTYIWVTTAN